MGTEDGDRPFRDLPHIVEKHGTFTAQLVAHVIIMHDLVPHIDGRSEDFERDLHDVDGAIHTRAEATGLS